MDPFIDTQKTHELPTMVRPNNFFNYFNILTIMLYLIIQKEIFVSFKSVEL